jgi:hypothetical protein
MLKAGRILNFSSRTTERLRHAVLPAVAVLIVACFYLATIRDGHDWGGDFSMYILHARNIVEGASYDDSGYIYNPYNPAVGPRTYPPVFPLLLSPVYKLFGLNFTAMKVETVLIFIGSLSLLALVFRREFEPGYLVALILIVGFNPYFWSFKDEILSDIPFLFFVLLSIYLIRAVYDSKRAYTPSLSLAVATGFAAYLCYGTRTIGVVTIVALLAYHLYRVAKFSRSAIVTSIVFGVFAVVQAAVLTGDASYLDQLRLTPELVTENAVSYLRQLSLLWDNGYSAILRKVLFLVVTGICFVGYVSRLRKSMTFLELFPLVYLLPVLLWPSRQGLRFLIPIVPFYVFYFLIGTRQLGQRMQGEGRHTLLFGSLVVIAFAYGARYTTSDFGQIREGVTKRESVQLFHFVVGSSDTASVFIFSRPRVLALMTGRRSSAFHTPTHDSELWAYFRSISATHLVVGPDVLGVRTEEYLRSFVAWHGDQLRLVFANADFAVYRIVWSAAAWAPAPTYRAPLVVESTLKTCFLDVQGGGFQWQKSSWRTSSAGQRSVERPWS